jgi:hypothetical protein
MDCKSSRLGAQATLCADSGAFEKEERLQPVVSSVLRKLYTICRPKSSNQITSILSFAVGVPQSKVSLLSAFN